MDTPHFTIEKLAEGIFAALHKEGGRAYSNAGILDLGGLTVIFDTFESPSAAQDLRKAAEELSKRKADFVVVSHCHLDHWLGNQVFADHATIISTYKTFNEMPEYADDLQLLIEDPTEYYEYVQELERNLEKETNPDKRTTAEKSLVKARYMAAELPTLELHFPKQTFEGKMAFHGSQRSAELISCDGAHTVSDSYMLLPGEPVAIIGDLGFFQSQPFMADCEPRTWIDQLERMMDWDIETFVPGHGPLGTKADIKLQMQYIQVLEERIADVVKSGKPVEKALQISLPAPFDAWVKDGISRFEANVRSSYERHAGMEQKNV